MIKLPKELMCFIAGVIIVIICVVIYQQVSLKETDNYKGTNQTRTDITACRPNETRIVSRDPQSGNIDFKCIPKKKESYIGLNSGGPRACDSNQTTQIRGLPNGAGLIACADKSTRPPIQSSTNKVNGSETFVNVGAVPGYNCTFKQTSKGVDNLFGKQYTCLPVKVNVASSSAEGYTPGKAYSFKTHSRANFVPNLRRNRVNFLGTNYRSKKEAYGSMSSGSTINQPIGNNRTRGCNNLVAVRSVNGDLEMKCPNL